MTWIPVSASCLTFWFRTLAFKSRHHFLVFKKPELASYMRSNFPSVFSLNQVPTVLAFITLHYIYKSSYLINVSFFHLTVSSIRAGVLPAFALYHMLTLSAGLAQHRRWISEQRGRAFIADKECSPELNLSLKEMDMACGKRPLDPITVHPAC